MRLLQDVRLRGLDHFLGPGVRGATSRRNRWASIDVETGMEYEERHALVE
jgi:hypothetical protein